MYNKTTDVVTNDNVTIEKYFALSGKPGSLDVRKIRPISIIKFVIAAQRKTIYADFLWHEQLHKVL
ncbi:hypothetical protein R2R64_23900 [Escherichia coli]|uniref:hypothetical protein n=1 Tax=Escherichia coli TaxID=562 RepID=UPI001BAF32B8|nr:hypothetical protein [Escherichia coli]MDV5032824.1 hypothetical protein [Escherichia coli]MDV5077744.1 hypothetical protein [Escherichia coli]